MLATAFFSLQGKRKRFGASVMLTPVQPLTNISVTFHDLGLLVLLLAPAMLAMVLLLVTFAFGGVATVQTNFTVK